MLFGVSLSGQKQEQGEIVLTNANIKLKNINEIYVIKDNVFLFSASRRILRMQIYDFNGQPIYYAEKKIRMKKDFMPLNFFYTYGEYKGKYWFFNEQLIMFDSHNKKLEVFNLPEHSYLVRALNPFINDSLLVLLKYYGENWKSSDLNGRDVFVVWDIYRNKLVGKFGIYPEALRDIDYYFVGGIACYVDTMLDKVYVQYLTYPYLESYALDSLKKSGSKLLIPGYKYFFIGADNSGFYFRRKITDENYSYEVVKVDKKTGEILYSWLIPVFEIKKSIIIRFYSTNEDKYLQVYKILNKASRKVHIKYHRFYLEV